MPALLSDRHLRGAARERGSAALEATVSLTVLAMILSGGLALSYFIFAKIWLSHAAYEASICLSTSAYASQCENKMKEGVATALPIGEVSHLHLDRTQLETSVTLNWTTGFGGIDLHIEDHRTLPLVSEQEI